MAISVVSFSFPRAAQPEARGLTLLGAGFLYRIFSPNWSGLQKLTDFLSSPSYIIVQSPTQYLPITGHLNGMFDRHQAEITVMQFTGHSLPVYQSATVPWDFNPVPYCQPSLPTPMEYALPPSLEWHVWRDRRSIYNTSRRNSANWSPRWRYLCFNLRKRSWEKPESIYWLWLLKRTNTLNNFVQIICGKNRYRKLLLFSNDYR